MHTAEPINDDLCCDNGRQGNWKVVALMTIVSFLDDGVPTGPNAKPTHEVRFRDNERLRKSKGLAQYAFHYDAQITVIVHRRSGSACGQHLPLAPNQRPHTRSDSATMNSVDNLRNWHNLDVMDMHNIP